MAYDLLGVCRLIVNYSNEKEYNISNLKLQKLLYYIQAYFLVKKKRPCFDEDIEAWIFMLGFQRRFFSLCERKGYIPESGRGNVLLL